LAALEPLGSERAAEPVDVIAHPPFEPTEGQIIPLRADCCPATGSALVSDGHLAPLNQRQHRSIVLWITGTPPFEKK
jgi:hypothetical protein